MAVGGTHMLGHAMASACLNEGVDLRYNHRVRRILTQDGRASGIELADGRQIEAKIVVSNLDVRTTCRDLLGLDQTAPEMREFLDNWRFGPEHCLGTPSFALHEPPDYKSAQHDPDINRCFYTIVGYENAEQVSEYILQAFAGRPPELPAAGIWVNTLWDPSQAPPGKHAMNGWYFFPKASDMTEAEWDEVKKTYNARFLALWEKYAPNMTRANVIADALYTPFDIEQEMGMPEGDFGHGRPKGGFFDLEAEGDRSLGWTRTGTEGLYLCAGNGVSAGPGYSRLQGDRGGLQAPRDLETRRPNLLRPLREGGMPDIYTTEWYDELKALLNRNPDMEKSAPKGPLKVLGQFRGDGRSPYLSEGEQRFFVVLLDDGKCTDYYQVDEPPPRKEFDFIFEIPAAIFEEVAAGSSIPSKPVSRGRSRSRATCAS